MRESEDHHDEIGLLLAVLLGFTIAISAILDWFLGGPPLNLAPLLEEAVTASSLIYHISVISIAVYIGYL
ncbi:MAG: hypothetical protein QXK52_07085, partial [Candidatus Bathyarchaeia archaeon]